MSDFSIRVFGHNWEDVLLPSGVVFAPKTWEAEAVGGTLSFEVEASGDIARLAELYNWVGYTLWIMNGENEYIAYGDIVEVVVSDDGDMVSANMSEIVNRIKVLYADESLGGEIVSAETEWAEDADSIALYGRRERLHTAKSPMRAAQAIQLRDTLLQRLSKPSQGLGQLADTLGTYATIHGVGFWQRLAHVYYANDNGRVEHTTGTEAWPLGLGFTSTYVAFYNDNNSRYYIHQAFGRLAHFTADDLRISVTGAANSGITPLGNNGIFEVKNADEKEPVSITRSTIRFEAEDDIYDSALGFGDLEVGDMIVVTNSPSNSGTHYVKTAVPERIEISPAFYGSDIDSEAAGTSINIVRGNSIEVEQAVISEHAGANITVTAHGEMIAQAFHTYSSAAWTLDSVEIKLRKVGAPTDGVRVRLRADSGVTPTGAILDSAFVDDADIPAIEDGTWITFDMTGGVTLNPSTLYWLEILRDGANDAFDFYEVFMDDDGGYAGGGVMLYTGAAYVSPLNPLSVAFRLRGGVDTALQVADICEDADVFTEVLVQDLSGIVTNQYRDGTLFASEEAQELLDTGDSSDTRLLAHVNPQRAAIISVQPDRASAQYVWRKGSLYTLQGQQVTAGLLPVGEWCHLDNKALLAGALQDASPFFVEYASYSVNGGWVLRAEAEPDPWDVGTVKDG
jgi:hypothetical protein